MKIHSLAACALLCAITASQGAAQDQLQVQTSAEARAEIIPMEAFTSQFRLTEAELSENGKHFAVTAQTEGKMIVQIYDADTLQLLRAVDAGEAENFRWMEWAGDDRLLFSVLVEEEGRRYWARASRLLAYDMADQELRYIGRKKQGLSGDRVTYIDPAGEYVLLALTPNGRKNAQVVRFPLDGSGEDGAEVVQKDRRNITSWVADTAGVVRMGYGTTVNATTFVYYRPGPEAEFEEVLRVGRYDRDENTFDKWDMLGIYPGSDVAYTIVADDNGRKILREVNYRTGELGKVVKAIPGQDVSGVVLDDEKGPIGVGYTDDLARTEWMDPTLAQLQEGLRQALGGGEVHIFSRAGMKRMLVHHVRPGDPGAIYVFTPAEGRLELFSNVRPKIDFRQLVQGTAHDIEARDGTVIRSYLTLPRGRGNTNLPLIVMPHGGPFGVRDTLAYDDWVQLLVNRGYAVIQPNYRGSGGYGPEFEDLGTGQIGRAMQDDLDDVRAWAVEQGYADPDRVCMVGGSYGGYASIWSVMRNPELYRCAVSWAGVTDWGRLLIYDSNWLGRRSYNRYRDKVKGETGNLDEVSPVAQIDRLARPLLIAHGKEDKRVLFDQYEELREAAVAAGKPVETLVIEEEGHGFSEEKNALRFLEAMVEFLDRHNPPE